VLLILAERFFCVNFCSDANAATTDIFNGLNLNGVWQIDHKSIVEWSGNFQIILGFGYQFITKYLL